MDFFDDETSRVPADAAGPPAPPSRRRRPPDRRRTRIQRLVVLAVIVFVVVFGIAWWARSCQHNRKVGSYETYFKDVSTAIADSDALGKKASTTMNDPTKLSRKELIARFDQLADQQAEIAVRSARFEPPGALEDEQTVFAMGMKVRADGFRLLRSAMVDALSNKNVKASTISALDGYFSGPDAYYQQLVYRPSREAMADDGVTGVAVPESTYYLTWKALDPVRVQAALDSVGKSSKLTGIHGVALAGVTATGSGGDVKLVKGKDNNVPASADLAFVCSVENQGTVAERDVAVVATLTLPGGDTLKQQGTIAAIESGKTRDITLSGFAIPEQALSKVVRLRVKAGPVEGERVETNNSATYRLLLQLQ